MKKGFTTIEIIIVSAVILVLCVTLLTNLRNQETSLYDHSHQTVEDVMNKAFE